MRGTAEREEYLLAASGAGLLHTAPGGGRYVAGVLERDGAPPQCLVEYCDAALLGDGAAALLAEVRTRFPLARSLLLRLPADVTLPHPWRPDITYLRYARPAGTGRAGSSGETDGSAGTGGTPPGSLRPAVPQDDPLLHAWLRQALERGARDRGEEPSGAALRAGAGELLASPARESWLYLRDGAPVGHITVRTEETDEVTGEAYVDLVDLLVEPPFVREATPPLVAAAARRAGELGRPLWGNLIHSAADPGHSARTLRRLEQTGWQPDHRFWHRALPADGTARTGGTPSRPATPRTSPAEDTPVITLSFLHRLLGVEEDHGPHALVLAAHRVSHRLPALVVSAAAREGRPLGSGARDLLARTRARAGDYAELYRAAAGAAPVQQLKGPELAAQYPEGLVRPVGDLDLVVPGEGELWSVAAVIAGRRAVRHIDLSVFGDGHLILRLEWPPEDDLLDDSLSVDLCTAAYTERHALLPVRADLPADPWLKNFLAVAEERFQRPFNPRDVLDVLVLARTAPDAGEVIRTAGAWRAAPEAEELLRYAADCAGPGALGGLAAALEGLREPAAAETARREAEGPPWPEPSGAVEERLRTGQPVYAMPLGEAQLRPERSRMELRHFADGESTGVLARTPLGDYLLVASASVDPDLYEAACAEAKRAEA